MNEPKRNTLNQVTGSAPRRKVTGSECMNVCTDSWLLDLECGHCRDLTITGNIPKTTQCYQCLKEQNREKTPIE